MTQDPLPTEDRPQDAEELARYRAVNKWAVLGLVAGLVSPLAVLHPLLWCLPIVAGLAAAAGLYQTGRQPEAFVGRKAAAVGLVLAVVSGTTALSRFITYRVVVRDQARQVAAGWLQRLASDRPHEAHQLTVPPGDRSGGDLPLWDFYRNNPVQRGALEQFVAKPLIRTLLALGRDARFRCYETDWVDSEQGYDVLRAIYAVTYREDGRRRSFFVCLRLQRSPSGAWWITEFEGGCRPPDWRQGAEARGSAGTPAGRPGPRR